jgi:ferric-dicitrate binding protein FerR (iron transport regulator)
VIETKTPSSDLLRRLATTALPVEDGARADDRRDRIVAHLAELVPTLPARRRQRRRRMSAAVLCSAAALAMTLGLTATKYRSQVQRIETSPARNAVLALEGSVQVIRRAAEMPALPLERTLLGNEDEVVTGPRGRARASLASGAEVDIDPESRVGFHGSEDDASATGAATRDRSEGVILSSGRVAVRVPKLGPAGSFAVTTPEATIVVHGTTFSVARTTDATSEIRRTSVDVEEGTVAVRRNGVDIFLHAGDHWSSSMESLGRAAGQSGEFRVNRDRAADKHKPSLSVPRGDSSSKNSGQPSGSDKSSSLAAENQLLQTAMAARQQGDALRAAELATEFVRRYPASPLVEEARVERMRALAAASGPAAAAGEARSYLRDYPRGFARQEANRILGSLPR